MAFTFLSRCHDLQLLSAIRRYLRIPPCHDYSLRSGCQFEISHSLALSDSGSYQRGFSHLTSPAMWGTAGVEFITSNGQKLSEEAIPMAILVTGGLAEGNLGMVTTFCCHNQAKIEASNALSIFHQCNVLEPNVVVVRRYTKTPISLKGPPIFSIWTWALSLWGCFLCPIPTGPAMSLQVTPLLWHRGGPACEGGRGGIESVSLLPGGIVAKFRRGALPLWPHFTVGPFVCLPSPSRMGTQMEERSGFHTALKYLQNIDQSRAKLECDVAKETQRLAQRYDDRQIKLARKYGRWQAQMAEEADAAFHEVFFHVSSTDSIKLLPWCFSFTVPLHYMSDVLATAMQKEEDILVTISASKLEGSQALEPSDSLAPWTETLPLPVPPLLDIPFVGTPQVGHPFAWFIASTTQKKWDHSPNSSLSDHHDKGTCVDFQEVEARSEHSFTQGEEDTPALVSEVRPSSEPQGQEPTSSPSSPTKATTDPDDGTVGEASRSIGDQGSASSANHSGTSSDLDASRENMVNSDMGQPLGIVSLAQTQMK